MPANPSSSTARLLLSRFGGCRLIRGALILLLTLAPCGAGERDALLIDADIRARHMPFGTILDPVFDAPDGDHIVGYTRAGDSAIWTGHYLAAECFRYRVTKDKDALEAILRALDGIRLLVDVTGADLLARGAVRGDSPFAPGIGREEARNGSYHGTVGGVDYLWLGRTSRDQYLGVFYGLAAAYDFVDDPGVRASAGDLIRRLTVKLIADGWNIHMPDGSLATTFLLRPDQQITLLLIARHVDPDRFSKTFDAYARLAPVASLVMSGDTIDPYRNYFKFNLDEINLYSLTRLDDSGWRQRLYRSAFSVLRRVVGSDSPFFMLIARAVDGPDEARDRRALAMLEEWLGRPRRDFKVDLRGSYPECGSARRSCEPIPVWMRVPTDFLWQRSPYQLYGGAYGQVESAGIDYLLPYWMARAYGLK